MPAPDFSYPPTPGALWYQKLRQEVSLLSFVPDVESQHGKQGSPSARPFYWPAQAFILHKRNTCWMAIAGTYVRNILSRLLSSSVGYLQLRKEMARYSSCPRCRSVTAVIAVTVGTVCRLRQMGKETVADSSCRPAAHVNQLRRLFIQETSASCGRTIGTRCRCPQLKTERLVGCGSLKRSGYR